MLTINRLGAQGDGIADTAAGQVYVPFALPGEVVEVEHGKDRATLLSVGQPSADRIEPSCRHFGFCGGCSVQHLADHAYRAWKRDKVVAALHSRSIEAEVGDLVSCAQHSRRRVTFSARKTADGVMLGYNRMGSNELFDLVECPIAVPAIVEAVPDLRRLVATLATGGVGARVLRLVVTATASGLDVAVSDVGKLEDGRRRIAIEQAMHAGLARLSADGEILVEPRKPVVALGPGQVELPPGAFLQATADAEAAMSALVGSHMAGAKRVADLFSGCGTFALRLAAKAEVHAVEGDAAALAALDRAARHAPGLRRITVEKRDLFRRPLTFKELGAYDGLVFDPPRAGAEDQAKQLARSPVAKVAAVSCNPGTLARDLEILIGGGYRLKRVVPIDQFLWSPHVEAVALLDRPKRR